MWLGILLGFGAILKVQAGDWEEARSKLLSGDYSGCISTARQAVKENGTDEDWPVLLCQALLTTGRYPEARTVMTNALSAHRQNIRLYWQAREAFLANGDLDSAKRMLDDIGRTVWRHPADFSDADELVISGKTLLLLGVDPKRVLDRVLDAAVKANPKLREVYLASGGLALEKHDFALAAKRFQEGLAVLPDDPDLHFGLAQAYAANDGALMISAIEAALVRNSNHVGSLLLLVDHNIDAEDYPQAEKLLARIEAVNPWHPDGWAYRAVLAQLRNQRDAEFNARDNALKFWPNNPRVDYLIGVKLSQNYRFQEGAGHQRQALSFDPDYLPAKAQLARDLLRLGQEPEGWKLAEEVQKQDGYDVEAYNLTTLHDTMAKFTTLTNEDFVVRMNSHEAALYGTSVLELLGQARKRLSEKYEFEPSRPTIVEVFHEQKDFAVRTFGMPGNPGYLGVCFGSLITANSPAAQPEHPVNWQAVLWHEFCHVVTLQMTRNKMPRWLSEGISVYEELQANPAWGQRMTPQYREMVLDGELTPIGELSAAFLAPPTPIHLQFAYYESSLVVEFLVQRYGLPQVKAILLDLGQGTEINQAIERHTTSLATLERDFTAFARDRATNLAPGLDFTRPPISRDLAINTPGRTGSTNGGGSRNRKRESPAGASPGSSVSDESVTSWLAAHATNYYALNETARRFLERKQFQSAKEPLEKLVELYPGETGADGGPALLAGVYHELGETNAERRLLSRIAPQDAEAIQAYQRLMEVATLENDWSNVVQNARWYLAVNPLRALPYRYLAQASEQLGITKDSIASYEALLQLDPPDPAEAHFKLAQLLFRSGDSRARRHLLQALEEAPRYQAALDLLLKIQDGMPQAKADVPAEGVARP